MTDLTGTWHKAESGSCADKYPDQLTFSTGTFRGTRGSGQGFIWWDAGSYRLESETRLVLTTATDELVSYEIRLEGEHLSVTDPDGCAFGYRRTPTSPPTG